MEIKTLKRHFSSRRKECLIYEFKSIDSFFKANLNEAIESRTTFAYINKYLKNPILNYSEFNYHGDRIFIIYKGRWENKKSNTSTIKFNLNWRYPSVKEEPYYPLFFIRQIDEKFHYLNFTNLTTSEFSKNIIPKNSSAFYIDNIIEENNYYKFTKKKGIGKLCSFTELSNRLNTIDIIDTINFSTELTSISRDRGFGSALNREFNITQIDPFCFSVSIWNRAIGVGYLKEEWSTIQGVYDLQKAQWIELSGTCTIECLK
jgi:hypothetical protein